jgi:hypothetical protein
MGEAYLYGAPGTIDGYALRGVTTLRASSRFALRASKLLLFVAGVLPRSSGHFKEAR